MPGSNPADRLAERIWAAWSTGTWQDAREFGQTPPGLAPAYAVQARLSRVAGRAVLGWKIAATSRAGQAHIGLDGPIAGRLLDGFIHDDGDAVPFSGNHLGVAEAEFAFRLGRDLPACSTPPSIEQVLAAVDSLHLAIELPDTRIRDYASAGAAMLICDNACAGRLVLGAAVPGAWRTHDLAALPVLLSVNGDVRSRGRGADALGDPRQALAWLAAAHAITAAPLRAGQVISTGVCGMPVAVRPGDRVRAQFGDLGEVGARLL